MKIALAGFVIIATPALFADRTANWRTPLIDLEFQETLEFLQGTPTNSVANRMLLTIPPCEAVAYQTNQIPPHLNRYVRPLAAHTLANLNKDGRPVEKELARDAEKGLAKSLAKGARTAAKSGGKAVAGGLVAFVAGVVSFFFGKKEKKNKAEEEARGPDAGC